jgi:L-lactate dehydrogenase (cytochrome)
VSWAVTIGPMNVLGPIVDAVTLPVMIDSGLRRCSDGLYALGVGAKFASVGRPFNYAAAYAGEEGISHAVKLLSAEVERNMALLGINRVEDMDIERMCLKDGGPLVVSS